MGIIAQLQKKSLLKHTERNIKQRNRSQVNAKLRTLGFLVDEALVQDFDALYDFSTAYDLLPKDVKVFSFQEVKKKLPSLRQNQINNKDFNWKGEIQNANAREFLDTNFDVLIGLYQGKHTFLDLMVSQSKAKFKVGCIGSNDRLYDLLIAIHPMEVESLQKELKKYLTVLNKI